MYRLIIFAIFLFVSISGFSQTQKYSKVRIELNNKNSINIANLGISFESCVIKQNDWIEGIFSQAEINLIKNSGYNIIPIIDDMTKYYTDRNKNQSEKFNKAYCNSEDKYYPTPQNFKLGSVGGFLSYDELLSELDSMKIKFPNLITIKQSISSSTSIEGRPLYYIKISDNPEIDESEPEILYTALHHAREPASMQQIIFFIYYLLENYGINNEVTYLVDNLEIYFIPCVNPDGYIYNQTTNPSGGGLFRKNRRNNGDGTYGVDLNRNYGYQWGYDDSGSSPSTNIDSYRGTAGFSEPETQIMKEFTENHEFKIALNYHCYSDLLIYPWGYDAYVFTPDHDLFVEFGGLLTSENGYLHGNPMQTVGYTGNGTSDDWMYGEQVTKNKIFAMSPEAGNVSDGFWPQINRIEEICRVNVSMNLYLAHLALDYSIISDNTNLIIETTNGFFSYSLKNLGLQSPSDFTVELIPISSNISNTGSVKYYFNMNILDIIIDSISFELNQNIVAGENIIFALSVNNGLYSYTDTVSKIFGTPIVAFYDNCSSKNNWTSTKWNVSTSQFYSSGGSITDSPTGNYAANENSTITLNDNINLTDASAAFLSFRTKYDIEQTNDYVQLFVSKNNGSSWDLLCGKYTKPSSATIINGQPVYDGLQNNWLLEEIDLSAYAGESIKFKFVLKSDWVFWLTNDGFYFDDFKVTKIVSTPLQNIISENNIFLNVFPIPSSDNVNFEIIGDKGGKIEIFNSIGQDVEIIKIDNSISRYNLDLKNYKSGTYFYKYTNNNSFSKFGKLIITK